MRLAGRLFIEPCQMSVNKMKKLVKTGCFMSHWHIGFAVDRGAKPVQIPRRGATESSLGLACVAYVIVFLGSIRCYYVVVYHVDGICGQRPSCVRHCQLCFPYRSARAGGHGKIFFTQARTRCRKFWCKRRWMNVIKLAVDSDQLGLPGDTKKKVDLYPYAWAAKRGRGLKVVSRTV